MNTIPLLSHDSPNAVVAYRKGVAVTAHQFVTDAEHLAAALPSGKHVLNVCVDRYQFTVGLAACLISGRISLLPSTHTPEVIRQLALFAPDAFCLNDEAHSNIDLPLFAFPTELHGPAVPWKTPHIPVAQTAAIVFTSGSTGTPLPYQKTWGKLARCVCDGAPRLGLLDGRRHTLVGTVPAQHMYGFESTVLLALLSGNAFSADRPFYPADIAAAVAAVPQPRALISTPIHLRTLLAAGTELPPIDLIVSATAPLPLELARDVEAAYRAPLLEIYGSTETGQIATRRTATSTAWTLWPDVRLTPRDGEVFAQGGHVEQMTAMCDVIEMLSETEFLLHGRTADLVNVAGKRSSFGYLNAQLLAVPGIVDGAFFLRDAHAAAVTGVARLAAAVVAPGSSVTELMEHLKQRIDAVFLPRPLLLVDRLPRNATGKLPQEALASLVEGRVRPPTEPAHSSLRIAADHPAYAGHFPGFPILPGAALLDEALHEIEYHRGIDLARWQVASVKFLAIVRPGDPLTLEHFMSGDTTIRFMIRSPKGAVASGTLAYFDAVSEGHRGA